MTKVKDLTGQSFGRWTVLERAGSDKNGNSMWLSKCTCGQTAIVRGHSLTCGASKACGCGYPGNGKPFAAGKQNPSWTGVDVTYPGAHKWLTLNKPRPAVCEMCKERPAQHLSYNGQNKDWTRNPDDYQWLCRSCHRLKDMDRGAKPLTKARRHRIREFYKTNAATQVRLRQIFKVGRSTIQRVINKTDFYATD